MMLVANLFAHPEGTYYLYGDLEGREVAMVVDRFGDKCFARYFDKKDKYDHILEGTIDEGLLYDLTAYSWDSVKRVKIAGEKLSISQVENHNWRGTWTKKDGTVEEVLLKRLTVDSLDHPFLAAVKVGKLNPYAAYRTRDVILEKKKKEKLQNGLKLRWYIDETTGIEFFRISEKNKNFPSLVNVNNIFLATHLKAIDSKYTNRDFKGEGSYNLDCEVLFLNADLISYRLIIHSDRYGNGETVSVVDETRSIKTGNKVLLKDIFWFSDVPAEEVRKDSQEWFKYRYNEFGKKIYQILKELYPEQMTNAGDKECNYDNVKIWQFPKWYLTFKGLYLGSKDVMHAKCNNAPWSVIPWETLKPYTAKAYRF